MRPSLAQAEAVLEATWGYSAFRPAQRRAILAALSGRDCLAVLPTGAGKSLCYQVPAVLLPGLTVVVSPLIALMQDQVAALNARGVPAAMLNSAMEPAAQRVALDAARNGRTRLLYVAPERLKRLAREIGRVGLLAVDEAHCISEWGHEFRPEYRQIGEFRARTGMPPTLAVTATATPATREDVSRVLGLRRPVRVETSFDRPNLRFSVTRCRDEGSRLAAFRQLLKTADGTVIVYTPTRNLTDGVASLVRAWGVAASPYHAGLPADSRRDLLTGFLAGRIPVMVATTAFGMGIDKPDVRLVIHLGIPRRAEGYYQEAGRAGRDGKPSRCVLLWVSRDLAGNDDAVMREYVLTRRCRRRVLLSYLGERSGQCSGCDNCR